ncbi:hypothetical protein [Janibacter corallicola]|nr:hypothetical protein [Janibacter corallicola]
MTREGAATTCGGPLRAADPHAAAHSVPVVHRSATVISPREVAVGARQ